MVQWEFEQQCLPILFINNIRPQPRWLRGFLSWGHSHQLTLACNHSNSVRPSVSEECRRQSRILKDSYSGSYSGKRMRQRAKGVGSNLGFNKASWVCLKRKPQTILAAFWPFTKRRKSAQWNARMHKIGRKKTPQDNGVGQISVTFYILATSVSDCDVLWWLSILVCLS